MKNEELFTKILIDIQNSQTGKTGRKAKTIFSHLGAKTTNSQKAINIFTQGMEEYGLSCDKEVYFGMSSKDWINFTLKGSIAKKQSPEKIPVPPVKMEKEPSIKVPDDFFKNLFEFESDQEYERFQASLDSNSPIAIFLIPKKEDFYSGIVERVLSFEIIRKRQYQGIGAQIGNIKQRDFSPISSDLPDGIIPDTNQINIWTGSDIHIFNQETMNNVILGESGKELIESEKFDNQFNQLALYSNKYFSNDQFFILFTCPSLEKIYQQKRMPNLDKIVDKVTQKLPYTFKLQCKYNDDQELAQNPEVRQSIINHFKILFEIPSYHSTEESGDIDEIFNVFVEFQKAQMQAENQLLHKIDADIFAILNWGYESPEHVYLKYFAINTLHRTYKYPIGSIVTEGSETVKDGSTADVHTSRPDVKADSPNLGTILVEAETLRGKSHLVMIGEITTKALGWANIKNFKELWLVVTGFEVARNYYQLQTAQHLISSELKRILGKEIKVKVFTPDYYAHKLFEVDLSSTYSPTFIIPKKGKHSMTLVEKPHFEGLNNVKGLVEEKARLIQLKELYEGQHNLGIGGILFYGLTGCGKTYLAKCFAEEIGWNFYSFSPADLQSKWIGESQRNIRNIFNQAKAKSPAILFIDELDSIAFSRITDANVSIHSDQKATINQLLIELNNIGDHNVLVIGATNLIKTLDPAIKRSGRFDMKIPIFPPNKEERKEILQFYISKLNAELKSKEIKEKLTLSATDFETIAEKTKQFTSSDIKSLINNVRIVMILQRSSTPAMDRILTEVDTYRNLGLLSVTDEQVKEFVGECQQNSIQTRKLDDLKEEWGI